MADKLHNQPELAAARRSRFIPLRLPCCLALTQSITPGELVKLLFGAASAIALFVAAPAFAQSPLAGLSDASAYGSVGYTRIMTNGEDEFADLDLNAVTGRVGARFGRFVGIEGEASFGAGSSSAKVLGETIDVELDASFGLYAVGVLPISENAEVFARVGVGRTGISAGSEDEDVKLVSSSQESVNYGIGGAYFFDGRNGIRADYTRIAFDEDDGEDESGEFDAFSLSYILRF